MAIDFTCVGLCSLASLRLLLACRSLFQVGLITKCPVSSARNQEAVLFHGCRSIVKCHFYSFWSLPNLPSHVCLNSRGPISSTQKNNQCIVLTSFRSSSRCSHSFLGILKLVQLFLSSFFSSSLLFLLMAKSFSAAVVLVSSLLSLLSFCFCLLTDATKHHICPRIRSSVYISPHLAHS